MWPFKNKRLTKRSRNLRNATFRLAGRTSRLRWHNIRPIGNPYLSTLHSRPGDLTYDYIAKDWVAARLARAICPKQSLPFTTEKSVQLPSWKSNLVVMSVGYHFDRSRKRLTFSECIATRTIHYFENAYAHYTCDTTKGTSGSPVFVATPDGLRVIGINNGDLQYFSKRVNSFVFIFELVRKLPAYTSMRMINTRTSVKAIKRKLHALGHWKERINNRATPAFMRAIKNYQTSIKQTPLGIPTREMLRQLTGDKPLVGNRDSNSNDSKASLNRGAQ